MSPRFDNSCLGALRIAIVLAGALLCAPAARAAARPPLALSHLTTADGLPQSTVMATLSDARGFVWFATEDGLVRYDEHELTRYAHSTTDAESLPGQFVWDIAQDAGGDLWLAVKGGGLARWHRDTDRFTSYRHDPQDPASLASDNVRAVYVDARGSVWVATTDAGIDILDPSTGSIRHLRHDPGDATSLSSDDVVTFSRGADDSLWIGTNAGLQRWDTRTRTFQRFALPGAARVMHVHEDRAGNAWVATLRNGLWKVAPDGSIGRFTHRDGDPGSLRSDEVRSVLEDSAGRLWVGTSEGLDLFDRTDGTFTHYVHDANDDTTLRDSFIMSLYEDPAGLLWIGTRSGGVSRWNPRAALLGAHRPDWLGTEPLTAFAGAGGGAIWVASLQAGLVQYDPARGERLRTVDLGGAKPMSLLQDRAGTLWIGTLAHGLKRMSGDGRVQSIPVDAQDPRGTTAAGVMSLTQTRDGQIWIGTFGGGANVLDPASGHVRHLPIGGADGIAGRNVTAIAEDREGNLWLGHDGQGVSWLRANGTLIRTFRTRPADAGSLASNTVYAITVDPQGKLWIGTEGGGLAQVRGDLSRPETVGFDRLDHTRGVFDTVYGVLAGSEDELWLSGNAGLQRLSASTLETRTYHREHGLQGEEFAFGAYHRFADGRLAFGGSGGFNLFDPAPLNARRSAPRVTLSSVAVMGVPLAAPAPLWGRTRFDFGYRDNIITLDFGVLDFAVPRGNRLAYRMSGLTDEWIELDRQRRITLTNLPTGTGVLEVRAASPDSGWGTEPLRLTLHRDAPPWISPAAYAAYGLLAALAIGLRVLHQRRKRREAEAAARRIERLAYFDTLTGLANRQRCMDLAQEMILEAGIEGTGVAVVTLDLLGLKRVNDSFGHGQGDLVLEAFAERLTKLLLASPVASTHAFAGRFGGDEFVLVVRSADAESVGRRLGQQCLEAFREPIRQAALEYFAAPAVGLAVYPQDGRDAGALFKSAETAAYHARASGNASAVAYSDGLADRKRDWLDLESRLRHAVQNESLTLVYQPKFRTQDRKLVGLEALMRWNDEVHGEVPPVRFIEIAESSGLILEMGRWLMKAVCRQQRAWLDRGIEVPIAVNCSGTELLHGDPAGLVIAETAAAGIPASLIEIELTESVLIQDSPAVQKTLDKLRSLGCRIALDDFGTGYSSLAYLTRFPPDRIKIDKAFVRDVDRSDNGGAVAAAILSLARSLHMTVTAEGVERVDQFDWLTARGCDEIQGFLLGRPMPAPQLEARFLVHLASNLTQEFQSAG